MATIRRLIGNIKGPKGDAATIGVGTVSTGEPGTAVEVTNSGTSTAATFNFTIPRGATGAPGAPGVTDYATTEAAGLVRVGDDFKIHSGNGTLSMKNLFTTASTLAKMVSEEAFAISLGKIAKAVDWVVDNAPNFFNKNTDIVDGFTSSLTDKALSANAGKTLKTQLDSLNDSITTLNGSITSIANRSYIVTQWVRFTYYSEDQLVGTYSNPSIPTGWNLRFVCVSNVFNNNPIGLKLSGSFLSASADTIRARGTGFATTDEITLLVALQIFKQ